MAHCSFFHSVRRPPEQLHGFFDLTHHIGEDVEAFRFVEAERRSLFGKAEIRAWLDADRAERYRLGERVRR
jgi:hypothetical protein